jgi:hypothetical protein
MKKKETANGRMISGFNVVNSVPVPEEHRIYKLKYPFRNMKVGESFVIDYKKKVHNRMVVAYCTEQKRADHKIKFINKRVNGKDQPDPNGKYVRYWRVR